MLNIKYSVASGMMDCGEYGSEVGECLPISIMKGEDWPINMSEYEIQTDRSTGVITTVKSKDYGAIKFNAVCIDQECGYVQGSVLTLYT
jgi:hypothetical protein